MEIVYHVEHINEDHLEPLLFVITFNALHWFPVLSISVVVGKLQAKTWKIKVWQTKGQKDKNSNKESLIYTSSVETTETWKEWHYKRRSSNTKVQ